MPRSVWHARLAHAGRAPGTTERAHGADDSRQDGGRGSRVRRRLDVAVSPLATRDQVASASETSLADAGASQALPLHVEELVVGKRTRKTLVRATRVTRTSEVDVDEALTHSDVVVERVIVGRVVSEVPPTRQEGNVTILPVVEEEVVVTRRLVLKEELHIRRVQRTEHYVERVVLRRQDVDVTRTELDD